MLNQYGQPISTESTEMREIVSEKPKEQQQQQQQNQNQNQNQNHQHVPDKAGFKDYDLNGIPRPKFIQDRETSSWPLFWFPLWTNELTARLIGLQVVGLCIAGIHDRNNARMNKIVAGIALHYLLAILGGSRLSPIGLLAETISQFFKPVLIEGAQKQFAAMCGLMFSGPAAILLLWSKDEDQHDARIAASVLLAGLAGAAALEGFLNFCFGCLFFRLGIRFGLISKKVNDKAFAALEDSQAFVDDEYRKVTKNLNHSVKVVGQGPGGIITGADYRYKTSSADDDFKDFDFNLIKHTHITYFVSALGLTGIALMWRFTALSSHYNTGHRLWHSLGYIAAAWFCFLLALYFAKAIFYPQKIRKEWNHPVKSNIFSCIPITILLFAGIIFDQPNAEASLDHFYKALFWTGSMLQLFLACWCVGRWFSAGPQFIEHCNPTMLFPPLGLFVAAVVGAQYENELCWLFFSFALIMWLVLFPVTALRSFYYTQLEDKLRPTIFIYLAASSVACIAYSRLNWGAWDNFTKILFWFSWGMFFTLGAMTVQRFFGQLKFEMGAWGYCFPLAAFALANNEYHQFGQITEYVDINGNSVVVPDNHLLTNAMNIVALSFASLCACLLVQMMIIAILRVKLWVPEDKWGPMSFTKTCHFSMRFVIDRLKRLSLKLKNTGKREEFIMLFKLLKASHTEHAKHEDLVVFPMFEEFFPGSTESAALEHHHGRDEFETLDRLVNDLQHLSPESEISESLLETFKNEVDVLAHHVIDHFDNEEINLQGIGRKHFPLQLHIELLRKLFESTDAKTWSILLPFWITYQPLHGYRLRMLRTLRWAVPERMQQIGRWLYMGIDPFLFERLAFAIPELVPRLDPGAHNKKYSWNRYW